MLFGSGISIFFYLNELAPWRILNVFRWIKGGQNKMKIEFEPNSISQTANNAIVAICQKKSPLNICSRLQSRLMGSLVRELSFVFVWGWKRNTKINYMIATYSLFGGDFVLARLWSVDFGQFVCGQQPVHGWCYISLSHCLSLFIICHFHTICFFFSFFSSLFFSSSILQHHQ